jgi:CheY-like chemotaxis protein
MIGRVLVVDDEPDVRQRIATAVRCTAPEVGTAATGEEALARIPVEKPDLVLLDVMMPGLDGFEVRQRLRQNPATAGIRVIHLTARSPDVEMAVVEAAESSEWCFLVKPFTTTTLLDVLRHLFEESRAVAQTWMVQTREERALGEHVVIAAGGDLFVATGAVCRRYFTIHDEGGRVWVTTGGRRLGVPGPLRRPIPGRRDPRPMLYLPIRNLEEQRAWNVQVEAARWRLKLEP